MKEANRSKGDGPGDAGGGTTRGVWKTGGKVSMRGGAGGGRGVAGSRTGSGVGSGSPETEPSATASTASTAGTDTGGAGVAGSDARDGDGGLGSATGAADGAGVRGSSSATGGAGSATTGTGAFVGGVASAGVLFASSACRARKLRPDFVPVTGARGLQLVQFRLRPLRLAAHLHDEREEDDEHDHEQEDAAFQGRTSFWREDSVVRQFWARILAQEARSFAAPHPGVRLRVPSSPAPEPPAVAAGQSPATLRCNASRPASIHLFGTP